MPIPQSTEFGSFYAPYIALTQPITEAHDLAGHFSNLLIDKVQSIPVNKSNFAYFPGKWAVVDVLQHMIDAERIFAYRLLRIARKDATPLPAFDEQAYAVHAQATDRLLSDLQTEWSLVRKSTDYLIASCTQQQLMNSCVVSGIPTTANALAFIIYGHALHHLKVLQNLYL